jgi:hypothetical protein
MIIKKSTSDRKSSPKFGLHWKYEAAIPRVRFGPNGIKDVLGDKFMRFNIFRLKIAVLTVFTGCVVIFFAFSSDPVSTVHAYPSGAGGDASGAPGENSCTDCHSQNSQTGQFMITPPANYTPGQTYTIEVRHTSSDSSRKIWGFEMTALTAGNAAAGTFAGTDGNTTSFSDAGRNYVDQTENGTFDNQTGGALWTFNWTAPSTNVGGIRFYAAGLQGNSAGGDNGDQTYTAVKEIQLAPVIVPDHDFMDFDGDGKADPSVFRPAEGNWYVKESSGGESVTRWGLGSDMITPADFDGDNKTDYAVWREGPATVAAFYIFESSTNTFRIVQFGKTGDNPAPVGDWDGDGKADVAVYRDSAVGSQSYFYYIGSLNNPGGAVTFLQWGTTGDRPMRGDFDGDGQRDLAVFRPGENNWYINQSSNGQLRVERFGLATDDFVSGDFDGDAKTDLTVFRDGVWYIKRSSNGMIDYRNWGLASDVLVPADYDGDGLTDTAVYRDGIWWINQSSSGSTIAESYGVSSDIAVAVFNVQ